MKRSLLVLFLIAFFSLVSAQVIPPDPVNKPKMPSDYPRVPASCENKVKLFVSNAGGRAVRALDTVQCGYETIGCDAKYEKFRSDERPNEQGACDDFHAAATALQKAEIVLCCDAPSEVKKPEPKKKCEQPTPWFDGLSPDPKCKDRQPPQTSDDGNGIVFLQICGRNVFAHQLEDKNPLFIQAYKSALLDYVRGRIGSTVCCDSFTASRRPGAPCDPWFDVDCDGTSNATDRTEDERFPDISTFGIAAGVPIADTDPFPTWFQPGDTGFMPPANLCDCKWELTKGKRTCSPDGRRNHVYQATWRCPSTGNVKFTRKEVPATEPCGPEGEGAISSKSLTPYYYQRISEVWTLVPRITPTRSYSCTSVMGTS